MRSTASMELFRAPDTQAILDSEKSEAPAGFTVSACKTQLRDRNSMKGSLRIVEVVVLSQGMVGSTSKAPAIRILIIVVIIIVLVIILVIMVMIAIIMKLIVIPTVRTQLHS